MVQIPKPDAREHRHPHEDEPDPHGLREDQAEEVQAGRGYSSLNVVLCRFYREGLIRNFRSEFIKQTEVCETKI